jgi:WD40 repeat protein
VKVGLLLLVLVLGLAAVGANALTQQTLGEPPAQPKVAGESVVQPVEPKEHVDRLGDPLPAGALLRLGTLRHRETSGVLGLHQLLSDGKTVLRSAPNDVRAELHWMDATTGRITESWPVPKGLTVCGFAPDGRLALFADDATLRLWDLTTRKELRVFESKGKLGRLVHAAFAPDGQIVVTEVSGHYAPGPVCIWEVKTGRQLWELGKLGAYTEQSVVGFLADGQTVVFRDLANNRVSLRDRMTGRELRSFDTMPRAESRSSGLSPDGKALVMGTSGPAMRVWDIATGEERSPLGGHKGQAHTFGFARGAAYARGSCHTRPAETAEKLAC